MEVCRRGISELSLREVREARQAGARVRLISTPLQDDQGIRARVVSEWVWPEDPLYHVRLETNAVEVLGDPFGSLLLQGPGAGGPPTSSALIADLEYWYRGSSLVQPPTRRLAAVVSAV